MTITLELVAAALVAAFSAARMTRLAVHDTFPPAAAVRNWYLDKAGVSEWRWLFLCHWCMSAWPSLLVLVTAVLTWGHDGWDTAWWLVNGWFALMYVAGIIVERDGAPADEGHDH